MNKIYPFVGGKARERPYDQCREPAAPDGVKTMDHDFAGRTWAENHQQTSAAIAAAIEKLAYAFKRLNALQYDAPWRRSPRTLI